MRIRRIEIENLASLRGEQPVVDLADGPLAAAGLVAITGATGAGKTTILDAVCLALFDRTPRLEGRGEDPRELLSRGAGEARAAVELELDDGGRWYLEWAVHRARNAPDGNLQASRRRLLDAATGDLLAEGKTDVAALVAEHLELDFEQFTGVILLAQGDFAKFLQAGDADRSELLEKLTGSEIYSRLSVAAFERRKDRQATVDAVEQRLRDQSPLPADERRAVEEEADALEPRLAALEQELDGLQSARDWLTRLAELRREHRESVDALATARSDLDAFSGELRRLERGEAASRLAAPLEAVSGARRNADEARKAEDDARKALGEAEAAAKGRAGDLLRELARLDATSRAIADEVRRLEPFSAVTDEEIEALRELRREADEAARARRQAEERIEALEREEEELAERRTSVERELDEAGDEVESKRAELTALDEERRRLSLGRPVTTLAERRLRLAEAVQIHDELVDLDADAVARQLETEKAQKHRAEKVLENFRQRVAERRRRAEEHDRLVELAIAGAELAEQRHLLVPGEPCPLCGSEDHPWTEHDEVTEDDAATQGALDAARERRDELREEARLAEAEAEHAAEAVAEAAARAERTSERVDATEREITRQRGSWLGLRLLLTDLPETPLELDRDAVKSEERELQRVLGRLEEIRDREAALQSALESTGARKAELDTERAVLDEKLGRNAEELESTRAARSDAEDRAGRAIRRFRRHAEELADACALDAELSEAEYAEDADDLLDAVLEGRRALREAEERKRHVRELERGPGRRGRSLASEKMLEEMPEEISHGDAEPVERSLDDFAAGLEESVHSAEDAAARRSLLADRLARAEEQRRKAEERREEAVAALRDALLTSTFADEDELRAAILDADELESLRRHRDELRSAVERADATAARAERELRRHLEAAGSHGLERDAVEGEDADLDAETARVEESIGRLRRRLKTAGDRKMELRLALRRDDEIRRNRDSLADELETARAAYQRAARLYDLIGHSQGDKFRRFAQELNLDQLLELANLRLERLAPRYALERVEGSLEIRVIDRDMADERRPVNTLSGGESFLVSLALALALADLRRGRLDLGTLFLDEGFGSLDEDTLDTALDVLAELQARQATQILIISHVGALQERIAHRIEVEKMGGGRSRLAVRVTR